MKSLCTLPPSPAITPLHAAGRLSGAHFPGGLHKFACALLALGLTTSVQAQEQDDTLDSWYEELPVVLSASRLQQPTLTAPASVMVIDRDMLAASGVRRLADVLRLVPGFYVGNLSGSATAVAYHGLADFYSKRMQVLVDGVSIYSPMVGGVDWAELSLTLEDVERIEVVRGPNAATFGANAFLAVINIITRDPATEAGSRLATNIGSNGIRDLTASTSRNAENFRYTLSYGHREDQGFEKLPDDHSVNLINFRGFYRLAPQDELSLQLRASNGWYDGGQNLSDNFYQGGNGTAGKAKVDVDPARRRYTNQQNLQLRWTHAKNSDEEFWVQVHHHQYHLQEALSVSLPLGGGLVFPLDFSFDARIARDDLELQKTERLADTTRLAWGMQYRSDRARSQVFLDSDEWRRAELQRLFANLEHQFEDNWTLHAGLMLEHNSISGNAASPRLAAVWQPLPHHTLRFAISKANRSPTINEEQGSMAFRSQSLPAQFNPYHLPLAIFSLSSGNLHDERILSREVAYAVEIPHWRASADLRVFSDQVDSLIMLTYTKPVLTLSGLLGLGNTLAWDYVNKQESAQVRGAELSARWQPWSGAQWQLAGSWVDIESAIPDSTESSPKTTWSWLMSQDLPQDMQLSLGWYRVAAMKWQSASLTLPNYETMDLRLAKTWRMAEQRRLQLAVVLRNVMGSYADYKPNARQDHQGFVQLDYQF